MDQFLAVCGFVCLYPLLVGALPMYLWMKYGRRVRVTLADESDVKRRAPVTGYAHQKRVS
jgi:hypothetical protein